MKLAWLVSALIWTSGCARPSPAVVQLEQIWSSGQDKGQIFEVLRSTGPHPEDAALGARLERWFRQSPDDLWLAERLAAHGAEPLWPLSLLEERAQRATAHGWATDPPIRGVLGLTDEGRPVEAWFVAGRSSERALVMGGVHGSEASGIEVVEALLLALREGPPPAFTTILVPALFPDNAAARRREDPERPTNRNFPAPGTSLIAASASGVALDALGRPLLPENILLLELIDRFRPGRIASVHATVRAGAAGIFSDPHSVGPAATEQALAEAARRSEQDEALALAMARAVAEAGHPDAVPGNDLAGTPTAQWSGGVPGGTSLGGWGPRAIEEGGPSDRPSISVITVEVAEQHRSDDLLGEERLARRAELEALAKVLREVFLER